MGIHHAPQLGPHEFDFSRIDADAGAAARGRHDDDIEASASTRDHGG